MNSILPSFNDWSFLVHIAAVLTALGYFFRDQIILRSLIIFGSSTYMAYYYLFPETPLWSPIAWSGIFILVNAFMIFRLLYDRIGGYQSAEEAQLFRLFQGFSPGMFRKLMTISDSRIAETDTILTIEDKPLNKLYYVFYGGIVVEKSGVQFDIMPGAFVGEVAYLTGEVASATVVIREGSGYVVWEHDKLNRVLTRNPELRIRLEAMFNQDMARKVQTSKTVGDPRN